MTCHLVEMPGGGFGFVCTRVPGRRCSCGRKATQLCDWKVSGKKSGTCDRPVCTACSTKPTPDKDLCPEHATAWAAWKAAKQQQAPTP